MKTKPLNDELEALAEQMRRVAVRMIWEKNHPEHTALGERAEELYEAAALVDSWITGEWEVPL